MELSLRQITNTFLNQENSQNQANLPKPKPLIKKDTNIKFPFKKLVAISTTHINFGSCIPGLVYEKVITITLKQDLSEPLAFTIRVLCNDQKLNELPQFVFAVKKDKQLQYTDYMRFRMNRKGCYDFVIGVKTPNIPGYHVKSDLLVHSELSDLTNPNQSYLVHLEQDACMPVIQCTRELETIGSSGNGKITSGPMRVLKFSQIKTKLKKEVRIPFKLQTETKTTIGLELLGAIPERANLQKGLLEINPKQMNLLGKGMFVVSFKFGFTEEIAQYLQELRHKMKSQDAVVSYTLRRILVLKVAMTNFHYHFPVEVNFFLGDKKHASQAD